MIRATVVRLTGKPEAYSINERSKRAEVVLTGPVERDGVAGQSIGLTREAWSALEAAGVGKNVTLQLQSSGRTSSGTNRPAFGQAPKPKRAPRAPKPKPEA